MELSLGMTPGFEPDIVIHLNDEPVSYYGAPLTVRRVGMVGKIINISKDKTQKLKVGDIERVIDIRQDEKVLKVKLEDGNIFVEGKDGAYADKQDIEQPDGNEPVENEEEKEPVEKTE